MTGRALGITAVLLIGGSCTTRDTDSTTPPANIAQVLERHTDSLMKIPGVVGTAEGSCAGRPCVLVLVERLTPTVRQAIPTRLDGFPVDVRETGRIKAR